MNHEVEKAQVYILLYSKQEPKHAGSTLGLLERHKSRLADFRQSQKHGFFSSHF
jgi:hypothetical protein